MKKVLSLVLALVLVLGMIPTFADAHETGAQMLFENNFIVGDGTGDLMVEKELTRNEMAVLFAQMYGKEVEAAAFVAPANFTDADTFGWASSFISFAQASEWVSGYPDGSYRPLNVVTGKELLSALMQVLGYEFTWETLVADAAAVGITVSTEGPILRGAAFETMWVAVSEVEINGEGMTIGEKTGKIEPPAPVVTELAVTSVTATNLKTMVIEFNKAVDEDTLAKVTVKKGTTDVVADKILSEDGMTLTVVYTTGVVVQSTELKVAIDGLANVDGTEKIEDYEVTLVVVDTEIPSILGVAALNAKQIEVYFSEPINFTANFFQVINDLKIDGVSAIAKATPNYMTNSIVFELSTVLEAGTYEVVLSNMVDFAGYKALTSTYQVTVVEDKNAPVLTNAAVKNLSTIEVTFDESLSAQGSFWVDGAAVTATPVANSNNTKYTLTGFTLDLSAIVQVKVEYQNQQDVVGNKVSTKTAFVFNIADDTALPTANIEVGKANKMTITFSKSMMTTVGTIKVLDKDDVVKTTIAVSGLASSKWTENNTVLTLTGTDLGLNNIDAGDYSLNIKDMKDATVRMNLLAETTIAFAAVDTKAPTVTSTYFVKADATDSDDDTITFYFSEAMNVDTLNNLSNYVLEGTPSVAFSAMTGVSVKSVAADAKSVTITYPNARALTTETFTVYALKDVTGNMVTTANGVSKLLSTTLAFVGAPEASATNKVVVEFNTKMVSVDPSFIKIQKAGTDYAVPVSVSLNTAGTKATFTLNKAIDTDTTGFTVVANNYALAENIYGSTFAAAFANLTITDKIAPTVEVATSTTTGEIKITFSEAVEVVSEATLLNDLLIRDEDGVLVTTGLVYYLNDAPATVAGFDMIAITGLTSSDSYTVELISRYVTDLSAAANKVTGLAQTSVLAK